MSIFSVIQKSFVLYFVAFLFDVMAEGVPSATGSEPVKEKLLIPEGNILVYSEGSKQNAQRVL